MQTCFLVGAAPTATKIDPRPGDFVVAVDGGLEHLSRWGIKPDLCIGDFDSTTLAMPSSIPSLRYSSAKDETDMELALAQALEGSYNRIELSGASGGRLDHTFANIQLLIKAAKAGVFAALHLEDGSTACALTQDSVLTLSGTGRVSVLAYGEKAEGVTIHGMAYALEDGTLYGDTPRGVSNELDGNGTIALRQGTLLVFFEAPAITVSPQRKT